MFAAEVFLEAFDLVFVLAVANHQVVVLFGNDDVVHALDDDVFPLGHVDNAVVRFVQDDFGGVGNIVVFVLFAEVVERVPCADVRPTEIAFEHIHVLGFFHDADVNGDVVALSVNVADKGGFLRGV